MSDRRRIFYRLVQLQFAGVQFKLSTTVYSISQAYLEHYTVCVLQERAFRSPIVSIIRFTAAANNKVRGTNFRFRQTVSVERTAYVGLHRLSGTCWTTNISDSLFVLKSRLKTSLYTQTFTEH